MKIVSEKRKWKEIEIKKEKEKEVESENRERKFLTTQIIGLSSFYHILFETVFFFLFKLR